MREVNWTIRLGYGVRRSGFGEERNRGLASPSMLHSDEWHQFAEEFSESSEKLATGEKNRSFSGRSRRLSSSR